MGNVVSIPGKDYQDIIRSLETKLEFYKQNPDHVPKELVLVEITQKDELFVYGWGKCTNSSSTLLALDLGAHSLKNAILYGGD